MPKRKDIHKILIIGSGPIVIGQACEFDYSGTQACKALMEEGFEVVLINSNPATIMTDPDMAHHTYIEPITPEILSKVIEQERPHAILPTLGGQTGLNTAVKVARGGLLEKIGAEMIGASVEVIHKAEDREQFRDAMEKIGLRVPKSRVARTIEQARKASEVIGYPLIIRPSFTLGGIGSGVAYNREEMEVLAGAGLEASMISEIIMEESLIGWKEFELEVMRDFKDNVVIICSIENLDPMGVHTGDSITVAPAQTLTDREYQKMRDAAIEVIREIGVETGGSNIQFAIHPENGEMVVIEMNPRVSRSSALASKATGFPIAKIAAKLAVGYTLDEIANDITRETRASFEPTIDYCVVKVPRWAFEKFHGAEDRLTTSMKSVGETMAIGRTFKEALQKAIRSLEIGRFGLGLDGAQSRGQKPDADEIEKGLVFPNSNRIFYVYEALKNGISLEKIYDLTRIDPWFLYNIQEIVDLEGELRAKARKQSLPEQWDVEFFKKVKEYGFSDRWLGSLFNLEEQKIREARKNKGLDAVYKLVDTCAAEFEAYTPYYYSTYEQENEIRKSRKRKVVILGGGPNRIGQGIEFDYCCVQASFALKEMGIESIMVNSNPETVSTDYDTSDKLYFEPLTREDVLNVVEQEEAEGVIVQFGGQTPLNISVPLEEAGVRIIGTSPDSIERAEDRKRFKALLKKLNLLQPENGIATNEEEAIRVTNEIGYPVLVRPSFVLGGRAMEVVYDQEDLELYIREAVEVSPGKPVLIDRFLEHAIEIDVDAISDGEKTIIGGVMEHIEEAGIHSGDSACVLPPISLKDEILEQIKEQTRALAKELNVVGLMNIQYAVKGDQVYVLEVNPRASRTVPFVSKATGIALAKLATKVMMGEKLEQLGLSAEVTPKHVSVKESVFPFSRFPGVDCLLGPEMKSTGEVMGIDWTFGRAFAKSQLAAGQRLPVSGTVFISVKDEDKMGILKTAFLFYDLGFKIVATRGTSAYLSQHGIVNQRVKKVREGRPHIVDMMKNGEIDLVINTTSTKKAVSESYSIRRTAITLDIPYTTTLAGARASALAVKSIVEGELGIRALQEYHAMSG
ncbi:MAG: carbamoyl-phosphate synthase large subunit [Deltaproteobacteria bacterium]|nr:carbamoyl-phosphate synthase large subunit [Deltaproteobacteria bacterium]MBW1921146.1 carbamoyl-phosphate synthase large subunit [Deltaproteobacteria bacterium]MBW1936462.1 carbamoyl-phosphate synthase large subunit [Deltaproteobacteria bacterium]MBW1978393.1 carbamoyl-phosphate synthase large subunit [Deltaproteobacteria bacterium]MBW2300706.1 carbamoyl-phosphate synthase large subunit [Deltaproteobacteria bacterium]